MRLLSESGVERNNLPISSLMDHNGVGDEVAKALLLFGEEDGEEAHEVHARHKVRDTQEVACERRAGCNRRTISHCNPYPCRHLAQRSPVEDNLHQDWITEENEQAQEIAQKSKEA